MELIKTIKGAFLTPEQQENQVNQPVKSPAKANKTVIDVSKERDAAMLNAMSQTAQIMAYNSMPLVIRMVLYVTIISLCGLLLMKGVHYAFGLRMELVTMMLIAFTGVVLASICLFLFQTSAHAASLIGYIIPPKRIQHATHIVWVRAMVERGLVTLMIMGVITAVVGLGVDTVSTVSSIKLSRNLSRSIQDLPITSEKKMLGIDSLLVAIDTARLAVKSAAKRSTYVVDRQDTYYSLAQKFNVPIEKLKALNNNATLKIGHRIITND